MYCRKCGNPIDNKTVYCKICGEKIIKLEQKSYEEKYLEKKKKEKNAKSDLKKQDKYCDLKNPYVIPAITVSCIGFILGVFPYPAAWKVGTSLWLSVVILVFALLGAYHSVKATQVNRFYAQKYCYTIKEKTVKVARILSTVTILADLFVFMSRI